jgi:glycosyltransferase involved in cell wall biosynthesis
MKTKIVYIYHSIAIYGGVERVLTDKTNQLAQDENFDITIITTNQGEHPYPYIADKRVKRIDWGINFQRVYKYSLFKRLYLKWKKSRTFQRKLKEYITKEQPDIIVSVVSSSPYILLPQVCGTIPWIVESHSDMANIPYSPSTCKITQYRRIERKRIFHALQKSTTIVTLTQSDAKAWSTIHPLVKVIPNGLNILPELATNHQDNKAVIFAGRFNPQKGIDSLFSIWYMVYERKQDWTLNVYGDGEEKYRYTSLNGKQNIHIHAATTRIFEKYHKSSFLVITSRFEPFGLVLIEAMSCGLPVIAFDCPNGPRDIITDGEDGFLIPMGNNAMFAERIIYLMEHPEERLRMGRNALKKSPKYSMEHIVEQWKQLYREVKKIKCP